MSFKALLFVQDKCSPCHRSIAALTDAFTQSDFIKVTPYKDEYGNKTEEAAKYSIETTPTLLLLHSSGSELRRVQGSSKMSPIFFSRVARYLNEENKKEAGSAS